MNETPTKIETIEIEANGGEWKITVSEYLERVEILMEATPRHAVMSEADHERHISPIIARYDGGPRDVILINPARGAVTVPAKGDFVIHAVPCRIRINPDSAA